MKLLRSNDPPTLQLRFPCGQTLVLAVLIVALVVIAAEGIAHLPFVSERLPTAVGSRSRVFDINIGLMDQLAENKGGIDCIYLGSSVVLNGINPAVVSAAYQAQTGQELVCYNFGVLAATADTNAELAELLVKRYQPRLLVFGFTLRALAAAVTQGETVYHDIVDSPWMAYQRGEPNLNGWLIDHLRVYRNYLALRNWMQPTFSNDLYDLIHAPEDGYHPFFATHPLDLAVVQPPFYFTDFVLDPVNWDGLQRIVALQGQTQVLLLEMPVPDFMLGSFEDGPEGYQRMFEAFRQEFEPGGVPLWTTSPLNLITFDGWAEDALHLNDSGAAVFSAWLGEQLAAAVRDGVLPAPALDVSLSR